MQKILGNFILLITLDMKFLQKVCVVIIASVFEFTMASSHMLVVGNDGPATLGTNITFTALLKDYMPSHKLNYIFNDGIQSGNCTDESNNATISFAFTQNMYREGQYCMNVTVVVSKFIIWETVVAKNRSCFNLTRDLIGEIHVFRENQTINSVDEVAVGENVTFVLKLRDQNDYLKSAIVDYSWNVDMERILEFENSLVYNFSEPGMKQIKAVATATFPNNDFKYGSFETFVTAKVPVSNVTIEGNPFIHHSESLDLVVKCNGTPPFAYCSKILKGNATVENFTCSQLTLFNSCSMKIGYFIPDGDHQLGIYISNDVKEVKRVILVRVYKVAINHTLSTIIIPTVCSILTLMIIAVGISFYIQQRKQLAVEVANFDFQDDSSDSFIEKTFFEKIADSITCRSCPTSRLPCNRSESDPLLGDDFNPNV